eukprot:14684983-Heterocapsa_arctica.AAC.1
MNGLALEIASLPAVGGEALAGAAWNLAGGLLLARALRGPTPFAFGSALGTAGVARAVGFSAIARASAARGQMPGVLRWTTGTGGSYNTP